jgi:energy-coupling factor transport system permease protein
MSADFDLYVRRDTWLHRLDPRVKLLLVAEATLFLFLWPSIWAAAGMVIFCSLILWLAQIPPVQIARVWRAMVPLMIVVFILTALFAGGPEPPWLRWGPLAVTASAVRQGAMLTTRLLALALVFFLWLFTTDQATMVRGFLALHVPYEWGLMLALALRYLPILAGLFEQVREAQQARGLDLEQRHFWQRLTAYRPVLVAMVITALRQSEHLGWALEARAMGARGVRRTVYRPLRLCRADWAALNGLIAILLIGIASRVL